MSASTVTKEQHHQQQQQQAPNKPVCLPAGKYDFRDAGLYIGEWLDEKAVGLGLITKDKSQGEYTGLWEDGSEKSGVFMWPNAPGAMYEGEWASNRRNGFGVFNREDWLIMGKFKDDFIVMGVKGKENTLGRFEGRFENGFPEFGVETYGDGGFYSGEYKNGIREGYGVRKSIPYGEVLDYYPEAKVASNSSKLEEMKKRGKIPSNLPKFEHRPSCVSERSGDVTCEDFVTDELDEETVVDPEPYTALPSTHGHRASRDHDYEIRLLATRFKCGFVLTSKRSELFIKRMNKLKSPRRNPFGCQPVGTSRKRTRSLSAIFSSPDDILNTNQTGCIKNWRGSFTSVRSFKSRVIKPEIAPTDTLELDLVADEAVEVYSGEWFSDARHGYGVCERTDGLSYYGQWFKNQRHGLGQTRFQDGTYEQGRYHNGKLVFLAMQAGIQPHLALYNIHVMREVQLAIDRATAAGEAAHKKSIEAREQVSSTILDYVDKAKHAAALAREYSLEARQLVREMYPDFEQPGIKYLQDIVRMMRVSRRNSSIFEAALQSAKDVIAGRVRGLTRTGEEDSDEDEQQPQEDLTLPPKFKSQIAAALEVSKKPISRSEAIRQERRARLAKLKVVEPPPPQPKVPEESSLSTTQTEPTSPNDKKKEEIIKPRNATLNKVNAVKTDRSKTPEAKIVSKTKLSKIPNPSSPVKKSDKDDDTSSNSSYVEIPNMEEHKNKYELTSLPLTKLLTNPSLFNNHFDQYFINDTPRVVHLTAVSSPVVKYNVIESTTRLESQEGLSNQTDEISRNVDSKIEDSRLSSLLSERSFTTPEVQVTRSDTFNLSVEMKPSFSSSSLDHLISENLNPLDPSSISSTQMKREQRNPDSANPLKRSDILDWFRSNAPVLAIICVNIVILHILFNQIDVQEDNG